MSEEAVIAIAKVLAWPVAVVAIALGLAAMQRAALGAFIKRWIKLGKTGVEAAPPDPPPAQTGEVIARQPPANAAAAAAAAHLVNIRDGVDAIVTNAVAQQLEAPVRDALNNIQADRRIDVSIRLLSLVASQLLFERIYNQIFGSQLRALGALNTARTLTKNALHVWYDAAAVNNPLLYENMSFDSWLSFLTQFGLANVRGEDVSMTVWGREFLKYLVDQGYPTNRLD